MKGGVRDGGLNGQQQQSPAVQPEVVEQRVVVPLVLLLEHGPVGRALQGKAGAHPFAPFPQYWHRLPAALAGDSFRLSGPKLCVLS